MAHTLILLEVWHNEDEVNAFTDCFDLPINSNNKQIITMGGSDSKIETCAISESLLRTTDALPPTKYVPPFRRFGELFRKKNGNAKNYVISVKEPFEEEISLQTTVFEELEEAFHAKTEDIVIEGIIHDQELAERWVFQTSVNGKKQSLVIRPFSTEQSHNYANIICETHFAQVARNLDSPFLARLSDQFVVHTGIEMNEPNSHVFVFNALDASLTQVIKYRRRNKWDWGVAEFDRFLRDLVDGLDELHRAGISHNDIRPDSIFFSVERNCYLLGNFANCQKGAANSASSGARPDQRFSAPQASQQHEVDLLKGDVYSLGLTLLSAFYLTHHVDRKLFVAQNKLLEGKYDVLAVIEQMLLPVEQRPSIAQIKAKLPIIDFKYDSMVQLVDSMRHRDRPSPQETAAAKIASGWAYQRLGLWNQWKKEYEEALQLREHSSTPVDRASSLLQLAVIDHCRGQLQSSSNYAKSAAGIYRNLGSQELQMGVYGAAESYFKKAIGCSKYYEFENDIDLSRSLQGLSRVHTERNEYKLARTLAATSSNIASKSNGKDSFEWAQMRSQQAKLETQFGAFESANNILEECLRVAERKEGINAEKAQLLRAKVLGEKGRNWMKWAEKQESEAERGKLLDLANTDLIRGVNIYQSIEEDRHQDLAYIVRQLGEVQFKREAYEESIKDYDRALTLLNFVQTSQKKRSKERGELLCLKGTAYSFKGDTKQALANYEDALETYRQIYGSDHNRPSALAIGNLGRVYINAGEEEKARDCLKVCRDILAEIAGQHDADYLHFQAVEQNLHQYIP